MFDSILQILSNVLSASNLIRADPGVQFWSRSSHGSLRRSPVFLSVKPAVAFRNGNGRLYTYQQGQQRWRYISYQGTARGSNFENQAGRMAEEARRKASDAAKAVSSKAEEMLNNIKRSAGEFDVKSDRRGRVNRAAQTANRKFEEFGYDAKRTAARWDREYRISEKVQEARKYAVEQIQNADRQLGVRHKARNFSSDFRLKWPTYRRQFGNFLDSPVGRSFVRQPQLRAVLNDAKMGLSKMDAGEVVDRLRQSGALEGVNTLVDVGGGREGTVVAQIVAQNPQVRGINYDLPYVIAKAPKVKGVLHIAGDYSESIPAGDTMFLKHIIHNYRDEDAIQILENCFEALPTNGKVILAECILHGSQRDSFKARFVENVEPMMLGCFAESWERTAEEYLRLLATARFSRFNVTKSPGGLDLIQGLKE